MGGTRFLLLAAALALGSGAQAQIAFRAASQAATPGGAPTYVASATTVVTAGSIAVARPAGVAQNDVLIAQITVKGVQAITAPAPPGSWALVDLTSTSSAGNEMTQAVYWRRVGVIGSEPASYTWSWSTSDRATAGISAYRNVNPNGSPIDVSGVQSGNAAASMTLPTLTTTQTNTMLVALLGSSRASNTHGVPTGMTVERYQVASGAGPNGVTGSMDEQLQAAIGSTGAKTATMGTTNDYVAHLLALRGLDPLTLAVPTGTVAGDVMVATIAVRPCTGAGGACTLTVNAPAGWTLVNTISQTSGGSVGNRLAIYWRAATGADPGASYTWTFGGSPTHTGAVGGIVSFSGVDTASPIVAEAGQSTASGSSHTAPSISTGIETNTMLVSSHAASASGSWTPPGGMTEQVDIASLTLTNNAGISIEMNTELRAAAGATGTRTATLSNPPAANTGTTHMLALRPAVVVAHYSISALSTTVANCDYAEITITGHNSTHAAVNVPSGRTLTLATSTSSGVWQAGLVSGTGAWTPSGLNNGAATYAWPGGEASFTVRLRQSAVTSLSVNLNDSFVTEAATEDPTISFVNSAFRISNGANAALAIGTQIAGKASNVGWGTQNLYLQAVRTDTSTGACVSLFPSGSDVSIEVGAQCNNPASCTQNVTLASSSPSSNSATFVPNGAYPASMNFRFTTANAEAPFALNYADAGQITLQFRRQLPSPPAGQYVQGTSNAFVTRPFGFAFTGVAHATTAAAAVLAAAGDNFSMTLGAYRWAAGQDANSDGIPDAGVDLRGNGLTPNFAAATTVSATGNLPGVATGSITRAGGGSSIAAGEWSAGAAAINDWRYSEVGNVFLSASSTSYLGVAGVDVSGDSGLDGTGAAGGYLGRFRPKQFAVSGGTLTNRSALACGSAFTYMNEGLRLDFTLTAQNTQNATTQNYTGAYAKLGLTTFANWSVGARSGATALVSRIDGSVAPTGSWNNGVANVSITTGILRATPDNPDGPYTPVQFGIAPVDSDSTAMNTLDLDADVNSVNERKNLGVSTEVRFGRLRMQNVVGSELLTPGLTVPIETQYWNGAGFATNTLDNCTSLPRSAIALDFNPPSNLTACETAVSTASIGFSSGVGSLTLTTPGGGNNGSVLLTANLGSAGGSYCNPGSYVAATNGGFGYLLGRWDDAANPDGIGSTNYDDKPSARAAFGLYGSQPGNFIYFRENY